MDGRAVVGFIKIGFFLFLGWAFFGPCIQSSLFSSGGSGRNLVTVQSRSATGDGLDLKALGGLVEKAGDAKSLEEALNKAGGINNLDLDGNGKVDYIHVTEFGDAVRKGFSLTVEPSQGEKQEIASIEVEKAGDKAKWQVTGSPSVYGAGHYYSGTSLLTNFLLFNYLFRPHAMYVSPWHYGSYPPRYRGYAPVPTRSYRQRTATSYRSGTRRSRPVLTSKSGMNPNAGRRAPSLRSKLSRATASQRAFGTRKKTTRRFGGFGRSRSSHRGARRSFGGGFGRRR